MRGRTLDARIFEALGDPVRRVIYARLRHGPSTPTDLARELPVTRSAVSRHLTVLAEAGLVEAEHEGVRRFYRRRAAGLDPLQAWLEARSAENTRQETPR